jgi:hypothetical protein
MPPDDGSAWHLMLEAIRTQQALLPLSDNVNPASNAPIAIADQAQRMLY